MDWCNCLVGRPIKTVMSHWTASSSQLQLEFGWKESAPGRLSPKATIVAEKSSDFESATYVVDCERGTATITGSERIVWQTESDQADESLHNERSPYEILLDQFCRRALGGLVPAPTAADALRALTAFGGALESAEHDRPVALDT